jgi:hypothetical protein
VETFFKIINAIFFFFKVTSRRSHVYFKVNRINSNLSRLFILISNSAGGLILDFAVQTIRGVAVFQPVMNGKYLNCLY